MIRRIAALLLALTVLTPSAASADGGPWSVDKDGDNGKITVYAEATTAERAEIGITSNTSFSFGGDPLAVEAAKLLGIDGGFSQSLHWQPGQMNCSNDLLCFSAQGWGLLVGTSERRMLVERLLASGAIDAKSQVDALSIAVDAALFVAAYIVGQMPGISESLAKQVIVDVAFAIWPDAREIPARALAMDWPDVLSALGHLNDAAIQAISDGIVGVVGSNLLQAELQALIGDFWKVPLFTASFMIAAGQFAVLIGRAVGAMATSTEVAYRITYRGDTAAAVDAPPTPAPTPAPTPDPTPTATPTPDPVAAARVWLNVPEGWSNNALIAYAAMVRKGRADDCRVEADRIECEFPDLAMMLVVDNPADPRSQIYLGAGRDIDLDGLVRYAADLVAALDGDTETVATVRASVASLEESTYTDARGWRYELGSVDPNLRVLPAADASPDAVAALASPAP